MNATLTFCERPWVEYRFGVNQSATVGQANNCELRVKHPRIALRQFVVVNQGMACFFKAAPDANSIYVNGEVFDAGPIYDGCLIEVNDLSFSLKMEAQTRLVTSKKRQLKNVAGLRSFKKVAPEETLDFDPYVSLGRCGFGANEHEILHPVRTVNLFTAEATKKPVNS